MKKNFCDLIQEHCKINKKTVFLTGDLGFQSFERLEESLGERFINCGISEANMIGVAAGLTHFNYEVWVYSIAPFLYARPFEQIRNDICFNDLPVKLVGNGGGYGYGVMGPTHHAIEDYGILLTLPNMNCYVPVINQDLKPIIRKLSNNHHPSYLRLGTPVDNSLIANFEYMPWRNILKGGKDVLIIIGPLASEYFEWYRKLNFESRPSIWVISELPIDQSAMPISLLEQVRVTKRLFCVEEHVVQGGFATQFLYQLKAKNIHSFLFHHLYAKKHIFQANGSQEWLQRQSCLDVDYFHTIYR